MSTKYKGLSGLTVEENVPTKIEKKEENIPSYIRALKVPETGLEINQISYEYDDDFLIPPEVAPPVQLKRPSEGSYDSIWKKPKIRPNVVGVEEEEFDPDEDGYFDDEEEVTIKAPSRKYKTFVNISQPKTVQEEPKKGDIKKLSAIEEEMWEVRNVELCDTALDLINGVTTIQKGVDGLKRITDEPINEV